MADKMQPGKFTLRFNMNDPQQKAAVDILNRMGRQKAQFLAQALIHYSECKDAPHTAAPAMMDEQTLEQAVLAVLARYPQLLCPDESPGEAADTQETPEAGQPENALPVWDDFMSEESLRAINKTLAAFRSQ